MKKHKFAIILLIIGTILVVMGLSLTIPFMSFANVIRTQYLIPTEKDREYLSSVVCGAIINLVINRMLIPTMGSMGAMIGTIAAEILVCIIQSWAVRKELPLLKYISDFKAFIVFSIIMFVGVYFIGQKLGIGISVLLAQIVIGAFIYGILCICYFYFTNDQIILKMLHKTKRVR